MNPLPIGEEFERFGTMNDREKLDLCRRVFGQLEGHKVLRQDCWCCTCNGLRMAALLSSDLTKRK